MCTLCTVDPTADPRAYLAQIAEYFAAKKISEEHYNVLVDRACGITQKPRNRHAEETFELNRDYDS